MGNQTSTPNPFVGFTLDELKATGLALNDGVSRG
jgi:hypothetical protein